MTDAAFDRFWSLYPRRVAKRAARKECAVDGCIKPPKARGWCMPHYHRWHKTGDPLGGGPERSVRGHSLAWLLDRIGYNSGDCLKWPFAESNNGYGNVRYEGRKWYAHRLMCQLAHGAAPSPEHDAAHSCGNRQCVNPSHLRWATRAENMADTLVHDSRARGERCGATKISEEQARQILGLKGRTSQREIAAVFGVSSSQVGRIHRRESWSWLLTGGCDEKRPV